MAEHCSGWCRACRGRVRVRRQRARAGRDEYIAAPPATTAAKPAASSSAPRVFFIEPSDGATVKSPVKLRFGIENYELAAVPQGDVTVARPRMGHHHVGVDTECLPSGHVIPKANPWVHHGGARQKWTCS